MRHYKVVRLLDLAKALASNAEGLTLDEMAHVLGANRRTVERMRDALRLVFPNLEEVSDGRLKRFRISGGLDGFMQSPSAEELAELEAAAGALERGGAEARASTLRSLAGKIRSAQRPSVRRRVDPDLETLRDTQLTASAPRVSSVVDESTLALLREALLSSRRIQFFYTRSDGDARTRSVEPYGFLWGQVASYLVGPEEAKSDPVLWRLDRIDEVALADYFSGPPESFSIEAYASRSFGVFQEQPRRIRIRFDAEVAGAAKNHFFHETQELTSLKDGTLEVSFSAGGLLEVARHVMGWGGGAEVLEPNELRELVVAEVEKVRARHAS
ncbi:WYL domain-containing protein [Sphingomonas sp. LHG3406-1]|uniref:helix-turn-helix transcriptional regulator n=1 Tax=Sphingomonas sp. LHG3406-1 TaxID=2804617 RepID=UPI002628E9D7|nr:WYL domain-containing protein [Sphingomonas sp. LHG3406-1]